MKVLLVAATPFEIAPVQARLREQFDEETTYQFTRGNLTIDVLITGVGLPLAAFALGTALAHQRYDLALQAGVAGAIDRQLTLGSVVRVVSERFADLGVEEADGRFTSVHDLGLIDPDAAPFRDGRLWQPNAAEASFLPSAQGISVNRVHGYGPSIEQLQARYPDAQLESMEGAAFFYACLMHEQPMLQIRAVSNYVEPRDREAWQLREAIANLNHVLLEMLEVLR